MQAIMHNGGKTMAQLKELLDKIKSRKYECEAGYIEFDVDFIALEAKAGDTHARCCLGKDHPCDLNVNDGFCAADECQYKVRSL